MRLGRRLATGVAEHPPEPARTAPVEEQPAPAAEAPRPVEPAELVTER